MTVLYAPSCPGSVVPRYCYSDTTCRNDGGLYFWSILYCPSGGFSTSNFASFVVLDSSGGGLTPEQSTALFAQLDAIEAKLPDGGNMLGLEEVSLLVPAVALVWAVAWVVKRGLAVLRGQI